MNGMAFQTESGSKGIQTEEFDGGCRFFQRRDFGFTFGKLFGVALGLAFVGMGIAMPFLSVTTAPGMGPLVKIAIGVALGLFGAFIISAVWRNLAGVLEVDLAKGCLRRFALDRNNKRHGFREIAFQDIRGVFTEGEQADEDNVRPGESLIITYKGRPGRLHALSSNCGQIGMVRDYILTEALHQQPAPVLDGVAAFVKRAKWEFRQRMN